MTLVAVWWSPLTAAGRDLLDVLDATEQARVRSLQRPSDQGRSLVAAALLRAAVGEALGVAAREVAIDRTCTECGQPHGRPRVLGPGRDRPHVSVSHSGLLVVVAVSPHAPVGVDVQRVADLPGTAADAGRAATDWVRHEALLKVRDPAAAVRPLRAPLDGYAAALAASTPRVLTDDEVVVRHWPPAWDREAGGRAGRRGPG